MAQDRHGQESPLAVTADDLASLATKLEAFHRTLTPPECAVLAIAFARAAAGGSREDVAGYYDNTAMMVATRQMQEMSQMFNLQYLMLQQQMQDATRQYTALSNIMKTKHDTAKNTLSNLR